MEFSTVRLDRDSLLAEVNAFYASHGNFAQASLGNIAFLARDAGKIVGVVRLATEEGTLVLRSMLISEACRGSGLGAKLLAYFNDYAAAEGLGPVYGLPLGHLEKFYGKIGFRRVPDETLPAFLRDRLNGYRQKNPSNNYFGIQRS